MIGDSRKFPIKPLDINCISNNNMHGTYIRSINYVLFLKLNSVYQNLLLICLLKNKILKYYEVQFSIHLYTRLYVFLSSIKRVSTKI